MLGAAYLMLRQSLGSQMVGGSTQSIVAATFVLSLLLVATGTIGPNIDLAALSALVLVIGVSCLWRPGEPPILLLVFLFQWLQASIAIFSATFAQLTVDDYFDSIGPASEATALTLIALTAMAIGARLGAGPARTDLIERANQAGATQPMRRWFLLYASAWVLGSAALYAAGLAPGLSQIFLAVNTLRWAFFFMLAVVHFRRGRQAGLWFIGAFLFELALGVGGYFSSFRTVFLVTFLAAVTAGTRLTAGRVLSAGLVASLAFGAAVVWTAIKPEYRQIASGGVQAQVVTIGYAEQIEAIVDLVGKLDEEKLSDATQDLFERLTYVKFFGATLAYVPERVPHENGALLLDAITRPFMPRMFFPEKTEIDDSLRTRYYTGIRVSGAETGTSISLGWVAELYIDFGAWWMMAAAAGVGAFYGLIYRILTGWRRAQGLLGMGTSVAILLSTTFLESSITKVIGGLIASLLAAALMIRLLVPVWCPWVVRARE